MVVSKKFNKFNARVHFAIDAYCFLLQSKKSNMFAALPFAQQLFKTLSDAVTGKDQVLYNVNYFMDLSKPAKLISKPNRQLCFLLLSIIITVTTG